MHSHCSGHLHHTALMWIPVDNAGMSDSLHMLQACTQQTSHFTVPVQAVLVQTYLRTSPAAAATAPQQVKLKLTGCIIIMMLCGCVPAGRMLVGQSWRRCWTSPRTMLALWHAAWSGEDTVMCGCSTVNEAALQLDWPCIELEVVCCVENGLMSQA